MDSSNLFSHPEKPDFFSGDTSNEPAQYLTFSDLPTKATGATTASP
jgi:hypothetical protein